MKHPYATAMAVAIEVKNLMFPFCEEIEICGSLRREKMEVSDIEILYVPKFESRQVDMFNFESVNLAEEFIKTLPIEPRLAVTGRLAGWGAKNKLGTHIPSGIALDLFCEPDIQDWPRSLVIRTGSKEFNIELMSTAPLHGLNAHAYGHALTRIDNGERVIATDERNFIELCGVKYKEPRNR